MKKLLSFLTISVMTMTLGATLASAQENETVVTGKVALLSPSYVSVLDEYISNQLYTGLKCTPKVGRLIIDLYMF